jgi:hypothetical protein
MATISAACGVVRRICRVAGGVLDSQVTPNDAVESGTVPPSSVGAVNDLQGALLFAGIPLATVGVVWALVFGTTRKPATNKSVDDDDS